MKYIYIMIISVVFAGCNRDTDYVITFKTEFGDMKAILYDETPLHKENFIKLAKEGRYDSTIWHRIIEDFMIQGGDINQKPGNKDSINYTVPAEFNKDFFHRKGAIGAARLGDKINRKKASSGCQFYIVDGKVWDEIELTTDMNKMNVEVARLIRIPEYDSIGKVLIQTYQEGRYDDYTKMMLDLVPVVEKRLGSEVTRDIPKKRLDVYTSIGGSPWLDDDYTVFGQVVEGLEIIDKIGFLAKNKDDKPLQDTYLTVEVDELPKKKITELYGISYPDSEK
ncbi:MAG: peptidylprolyl isomerase [Cyclobacteriaceae bacterium]|nr:peptidylprolyl isomerase [Cyclobacteriaceae bacterium]